MFFIVGSARSGTTLLRMVMNAHPEVAVPPESRFVVQLYEGDEVKVKDFLGRLESHKRFAAWQLPIESVADILAGPATVPYREAVEAAYRAYAAVRNKSRWGDKTPRYIEHIPFLARLFPDARFVHVVRDGRNVALSYADVPFGPKTVVQAATLWEERVRQGLLAGRSLEAGRYVELRYETFVDEPQAQIEALCSFLDLEFDPAMLEERDAAASELLERAARYNPNVLKEIGHTRSWEEQMSRRQVEVFEAVAGEVLSELGYGRAFPRPGASARLVALLGRLGLPLGRLEGRRTA